MPIKHFAGCAYISLFVLSALWTRTTIASPDDDVIDKSRALLWHDNDGAMAVLEDGLRQSPNNFELWVEYVKDLRHIAPDDYGIRASLHALKLFPNNPDLLILRAAQQDGSAALDTLRELAKLKGYDEQAETLADWARCGQNVPNNGVLANEAYPYLVDRLVATGNTRRAWRYLVGPQAPAADLPAMIGRKAIVLALDNQFDEALAANKEAGNLWVKMDGTYWGLPDALICKAQITRAHDIFSSMKNPPPECLRMLALTKAFKNDFDGALQLVTGDGLEDKVLRFRILVLADRMKEAQNFGSKLVAPMEMRQGSYDGSWIVRYSGPIALEEPYVQAIDKLHDFFPDNDRGIDFELGARNARVHAFRPPAAALQPISDYIAQLEAQLKIVPAEKIDAIRAQLALIYARADRYQDAARTIESTPFSTAETASITPGPIGRWINAAFRHWPSATRIFGASLHPAASSPTSTP
jgi:hypothetical protein